jgi:hypothetical protein
MHAMHTMHPVDAMHPMHAVNPVDAVHPMNPMHTMNTADRHIFPRFPQDQAQNAAWPALINARSQAPGPFGVFFTDVAAGPVFG